MKGQRKVFFIVNLGAGRGRVERIIQSLLKTVEELHIPYEWVLTRRPGDGVELARRAVYDGFKKIVAVGGDGTVNEVAQGLLRTRRNLIRGEVSMGIVRGGTGDDFARALGIPSDIKPAIELISAGNTVDIDVGKISFGEQSQYQYFLNVLGLGIDAQAAAIAQSIDNINPDLAYAYGILNQLFVFRTAELSLEMPEWSYPNRKTLGVIIANGRSEGKTFKVAPSALLNDGLLNVCVLGSIPRWLGPIRFLYALGALGGLLERWHSFLPWVYYQKTQKLTVTVPSGWICHLDGNVIDLNGISKLEVEILPQALRVITGPRCLEFLAKKRESEKTKAPWVYQPST